MTKFAYITFVNNNQKYMDLMLVAIDAVLEFSKHTIIIYLVDISKEIEKSFFPISDRIIYRHANVLLPCIFYYKPWIIIDAINQGLESGYYIEADDVITPLCDKIEFSAENLTNLPISPIHPNETNQPSNFLMSMLGVVEKTQPYIHAHVLFKNTNLPFLHEWLDACMKIRGENWDESALNCMYWKHGCKNHYLQLNDPWHEQFYTNTVSHSTAFSYHGCKDSHTQRKLLTDIRILYSTLS